jgi:hypothetical protein
MGNFPREIAKSGLLVSACSGLTFPFVSHIIYVLAMLPGYKSDETTFPDVLARRSFQVRTFNDCMSVPGH